jgi:hypothetical protein
MERATTTGSREAAEHSQEMIPGTSGFRVSPHTLQSAIMDERIYECEVKRLFIRDGEKVRDWKRVAVTEALAEKTSDVRCAECHGQCGFMDGTSRTVQLRTQNTVRDS